MHNGCRAALHAAIKLALGDGYACFPAALSKRPLSARGLLDATSDPIALRQLWQRFPGPLVGIRTGPESGIDVLDIDQRPQAREWLQQHRAHLPDTRVHRSRSGGLHFIFRHADGLRCSTSRIAVGIDIKASGGCATWWPASGLPVLRDVEPLPWPAWLLARLRPPPPPPARPVVADDHRLQRILRHVAGAPEGSRNTLAFWGGCRVGEMVAAGVLQEASAAEAIIEAAVQAGLPRLEAQGAVRSGIRTTGSRR
jgi:Bifunctional DNA primase/polymerase, N-terminal